MSKGGKPAGKGAVKDDEPILSPPIDPGVYVILEAGDGERIFVDRNCARLSKLCKSVLNALEGNTPTDTIDVRSSVVTYRAVSELIPRPSVVNTGSSGELQASPSIVAGGVGGVIRYPCLTLKFLSASQLIKAVRFMHYKYRYDAEAEKKPTVLFPATGGVAPQGMEGSEWAAIATLLQL